MRVPDISRREPQPALAVPDEVRLDEIGPCVVRHLRVCFRRILALGVRPAGAPFTRYLGFTGDGRLRLEAGWPTLDLLPPSGRFVSIVLDGGLCVSLMHGGPYRRLAETHAELDEWFAATGRRPAGCRWEAYLTDHRSERHPGLWRTLITQAIEE